MIENIEIKKLTLLKNNPRKITKDQFRKLCDNIKQDPDFFNKRPALVNRKDGLLTIYAGNQRVRAAKNLGWKEVPCIIDDELPDDLIKKRTVLDNLHNGEFDYDILASEFDIDNLLDLGFTPEQLHLDLNDDDKKKSAEKKSKICPSCGHEF